MFWFFILAAILVGAMMPIQAGINAKLSGFVGSSYLATFLSFLVGTLVSGLMLFIQRSQIGSWAILPAIPVTYLIGGLLGAIFVFSALFLIQKIGATALMIAFLSGQLLTSLIIDHYGLFAVPIQSINVLRILGILFLFIGLYFITKF